MSEMVDKEKKSKDMRWKEDIAITVVLVGFFLLLYAVQSGVAEGFDDTVRQFFYGMRRDWLTPVVKLITYLGNWQTVTALCIVLLVFPPTRNTYGIPVSIGAILVSTLNKWIKGLVQRPRPDEALHLIEQGGFSFPSGHSITSMFVFGLLICLIRINVKDRKTADILTVLLAIPMIFVGLSRIYLGVHYPTDVLAGWCLGIAVIIILKSLVMRIKYVKMKTKSQKETR